MNFKDAVQALTSLNLTKDDKRSLEQKGTFATQVAGIIGKSVQFVKAEKREYGSRKLTVLRFASAENDSCHFSIAYDMQNIFFDDQPDKSLKSLGEGNEGAEVFPKLAKFQIVKVVPTKTWGLKYSKASQELGISLSDFDEKDVEDIPWKKIRGKWLSDPKFKEMRTDAERDISWLEIQHVFIKPLES
jgi:hypothetical protein